jgi:hypothetical protein
MLNVNIKMANGKFVISLDFELYWGMWDIKTIEEYGANVRGVQTVIPGLLEVFHKHQIHATFSTVGFLFFKNKEELLHNLPEKFPGYINKKLSPYESHLQQLGDDFNTDVYHYAPHLIKLIQQYPDQEIGTHTFCHYYCLEEGQSLDEFKADIQQAKKIALNYGLNLTSLVFPRNQFNEEYLNVCKEVGIICYRGNEQSWLYTAKNDNDERLYRRALRLMDAYINLSGHNCYTDEYMKQRSPVNIPASRFLRPYSKKLNVLDSLRLKRITSGMTFAAKNNLTYHLWWHPHNFGINQKENFGFLEKILRHYQQLNKKYNFRSYTMSELAKSLTPSE